MAEKPKQYWPTMAVVALIAFAVGKFMPLETGRVSDNDPFKPSYDVQWAHLQRIPEAKEAAEHLVKDALIGRTDLEFTYVMPVSGECDLEDWPNFLFVSPLNSLREDGYLAGRSVLYVRVVYVEATASYEANWIGAPPPQNWR